MAIMHYRNDSATGAWLRELVQMMAEGELITLTTPSGEPIVTTDVLTAQDLVEAAA